MLASDSSGDPVVVHTGKGGHVLGYDPGTGEVRWEVEVGMHENDDLTTFDSSTTVLPGVLGGVETPPAAADGVGYFAVVDAASTYDSPEQLFNLAPQLGTHPSTLVALDLATGEERWSTDLPGDGLGGATVVGDLVLTSTSGGLLLAYDRDSGEEVWRREAGGAVNGWPAVVGDTIVWPVSGGDVSHLLALRLPS
ncbi:MAG TPA: PQQ-binding-like beta-propeller repeat protein [Iamia sp.]|nr:PQQ-binding-like beta-propeller repeat protein [Iamia sp.]